MPPYNIPVVSTAKDQTNEMADDRLPSNTSEQRLMGYEAGSTPPPELESSADQPRISKTQIITVLVLCYVNLINYMDRFTVAGILPDIQETFSITAAQGGLLQTAFVLVYMVMAPTYGYLGDRFNRKYLMAFGVFFWSLTTLIGSFMPNYALFLVFRCLVGVGEASYSTIAPTIISDMFVKDQRSKMLAFFYFAIPVGSGLGYMVGAEVTNLAKGLGDAVIDGGDPSDAWRWGLRVTPVMGALAVLLILFVMTVPPRGEVEGGEHLKTTNFGSDIKYLATNKSYVFSTIAFTCVTFVAGALAWWGPTFVQLGVEVQNHPNANPDNVAFVFGAIAMIAGLVGVPLGSLSGALLRRRIGYGDTLVCGVGLLLALPFIILATYLADTNTTVSYVVVFFGQVFLNLNWAVISDVVLYIVIPTRRSSAEAFQILFSHALGDAGSPYMVGQLTDFFKPMFMNNSGNGTASLFAGSFLPPSMHAMAHDLLDSSNFTSTMLPLTTTTTVEPDIDDKYAYFMALQLSMYVCAMFLIIGAAFFFITCCFITDDKSRADKIIAAAAAAASAAAEAAQEDEEGSTHGSAQCSTDSTDSGSLDGGCCAVSNRYTEIRPDVEQTRALIA